jgi:hypothetical protein
MVLPFLKGLLGSERFGALGAWRHKSEGATVASHHHFVHSPLLSFFFFWACCFVVAPTFPLV